MKMNRQSFRASEQERAILASRLLAAQNAAQAAVDVQNLLNEHFTLFCEGKGLPKGCRLVSIDKQQVVVDVPRNGKGKKAGK